MLPSLDEVCLGCYGQGIQPDSPCKNCEGYGFLLTAEGRQLMDFLSRRGVAFPLSPLAEDELRGMVE